MSDLTDTPVLTPAEIQLLFTMGTMFAKSAKWPEVAVALNAAEPEKDATVRMRFTRIKAKFEKNNGGTPQGPQTPKKAGDDVEEGQAGAVKTPKTPTKGADGAGEAQSTKKASIKKTPVKTTDGAGDAAPAIKKRGRGRPSKVSKVKELEEAAATEQLEESSPSKKPKLDLKVEGSDEFEV